MSIPKSFQRSAVSRQLLRYLIVHPGIRLKIGTNIGAIACDVDGAVMRDRAYKEDKLHIIGGTDEHSSDTS